MSGTDETNETVTRPATPTSIMKIVRRGALHEVCDLLTEVAFNTDRGSPYRMGIITAGREFKFPPEEPSEEFKANTPFDPKWLTNPIWRILYAACIAAEYEISFIRQDGTDTYAVFAN